MPDNTYKNPYEHYYWMLNPYRNNTNVKSPYLYDQDRMDDMISEMFFPQIVVAGSKDDFAQQNGFGTAYEQTHTRDDGSEYTALDRSHFIPTPIFSLIAFGQNYVEEGPHSLLRHISEEIPHAWLYANGYQDWAEMGLDLALYGTSGQKHSYHNPFSFEGFTHGINTLSENKKRKKAYENLLEVKKIVKDLGLEDLLVDFDNDGKKDYIVPGFTNGEHSPIGAQYWLEAYLRKNIDKKTRDKAIEKLANYHRKGRTDAYYDQAWNFNTDNWALRLREHGVTDGGDLVRSTSPILNSLNFILENTNIIAARTELNKKEKELEKAYKNKEITKEEYRKIKKQYKIASESLDKRAYSTIGDDYSNAIKEVKNLNPIKAAKHAVKGTLKVQDNIAGAKMSALNIGTNLVLSKIPLKHKTNFKKRVYSTIDSGIDLGNKYAPEFVKKGVNAALPYVKKGLHSVWNVIPSGNLKDAVKDNRVVKGLRNLAKRYNLWKNGGVLNILDMLIY